MQTYQYLVRTFKRFDEKELETLFNQLGAQGFHCLSLTPVAELGMLSGPGGTTTGLIAVFERVAPTDAARGRG